MSERIAATTLDEQDLNRIIPKLWARFSSQMSDSDLVANMGPERNRLLDKVQYRRLHLHNSPLVDPDLPAPYATGHKAQAIQLMSTSREYIARLTENPYRIGCKPLRDRASQRGPHNRLEVVLNSGVRFVEDRSGLDIQRCLAEGAVNYYGGWLHWRKADELWPEVPEYEYLDDLPRDDNGKVDQKRAKRYRPNREYVAESGDTTHKRYRESDESLRERHTHAKAKAGFPWWIECPHPDSIAFVEDRSAANGYGMVLLRRSVGYLDYRDRLKSDDLTLCLYEDDPKLRVYVEREAPADYMPSGDAWEQRIEIAELWTRDEFYELARPEHGSEWELIKSGKHPYGMPPFALAVGVEHNEADPAWRYEPMLEGMYRLKPSYDRMLSLMHALAESIALPFYYLKRVSDGLPRLDEKGQIVTFTRNAAMSMKPPDGYEIAQLEFEMNPAFVESQRLWAEAFADARPNTGFAEIGATTQPWTARLEQQQANVEPKMVLRNIARAITIMARNMTMVMSLSAEDGGFGEPICVYKRTDSGDIDTDEVVSVSPDEIASLDVYVDITPESTSERITLQQHGMELMRDPNVGLTPEEYIEEYEGKANPEEIYAKRRASYAYRTYVEPGLIKQELTRWMGVQVVMGLNGEFVGVNGPMTPEQVLQANGQQPVQQAPVVNPTPGGQVSAQGATMPQMGQLSAPNTIPLAGPVA